MTEGIAACVEQAKAAAGGRYVMLHGAYTAQECLRAAMLDVLELQLMPVLLGQGRLVFDGLPLRSRFVSSAPSCSRAA